MDGIQIWFSASDYAKVKGLLCSTTNTNTDNKASYYQPESPLEIFVTMKYSVSVQKKSFSPTKQVSAAAWDTLKVILSTLISQGYISKIEKRK